MKIAIVCDVLGKKNNGTTIAAYNLIDSLIAKGHEVIVVCSDEKILSDCAHVQVPTLDLHFKALNNYVSSNDIAVAVRDDRIIYNAIKDVDHCHIMMPFSLGGFAAQICQRKGISSSAGFHVQAENFSSHFKLMNAAWFNSVVYRLIRNRLYNRVNSIHYPTEFIYDLFSKYRPTGKPYIISNGVVPIFKKLDDVKRPDEYEGKFVILSTGRYSREKDQITLIRAVKYSKYADKIQLIFAGDGPLKKKFIYHSRRLKNPLKLALFTREELVKVINYSDLYVHTAICEIEAIACLEALSCGLVPIIANSRRSATRKFSLSEHSSFIHHNPRDLAKKIDFMIENPAVKQELSNKYLEFSNQKFSLDDCMDKMEAMIIETYKENVKKMA
ncbi:MAG: glycosyltransferase [Erysipelotrichaceae bacterium]|jgi:glycosyltransferase involved in cell wall biosynthesis|nr:glycosyltransferase [Erysipelotrichaceae bacterium]